MEENVAIEVLNISKVYKLYDKPADRLKESLHPLRKQYHKDFYALKDISFNVKKGETVGIIGKNGSGKSTLLKIITGVLTQSGGSVNKSGKISSLLELGAGFNPQYTGIENIYLNGTIMGHQKEDMDKRIERISSFADIGEYIYQPVKTYSSGMFVRLAFAVAINVEPEILIIDEALSVGDIRFQQKCYRKIMEFKNSKTILFVSHDLSAVNNFCDRVIWLNDGEKIEDGAPHDVIEGYRAFMSYNLNLEKSSCVVDSSEEESSLEIDLLPEGLSSFGEGSAKIVGASLYDQQLQKKIRVLRGLEKVVLLVNISVLKDIEMPIVGFTLKDRLGYSIIEVNNIFAEIKIDPLKKGTVDTIKLDFTFPNLKSGYYALSVAIAEGSIHNHIQHHWVHDVIVIEVKREEPYADNQGLFVVQDLNVEIL